MEEEEENKPVSESIRKMQKEGPMRFQSVLTHVPSSRYNEGVMRACSNVDFDANAFTIRQLIGGVKNVNSPIWSEVELPMGEEFIKAFSMRHTKITKERNASQSIVLSSQKEEETI
eukprot:6152084-Ditylum_brightwellii.AAC.1